MAGLVRRDYCAGDRGHRPGQEEDACDLVAFPSAAAEDGRLGLASTLCILSCFLDRRRYL